MKLEARPYQIDCVESVFSAYGRGATRLLGQAATGLGKTFVAGLIIDELPKRINCAGRVLWLTHEEALIEQSALSVAKTLYPDQAQKIDLCINHYGGFIPLMNAPKDDLFQQVPQHRQALMLLKNQVGIVKQKLFNIDTRLVVASVQTIVNRLDKIDPSWFDLIICDECHLFAAPQFRKVLDYFTPKIRLGVTATKDRLDGVSLGNLFDEQVFDYDIKFGIDNKYLCELEAVLLSTNISLDSVRKTGGEFNQGDLKILDCPERNIKIVNKWMEVAQDRPTIMFCVNVDHAVNMVEHFEAKGIKATFVVADETLCPDRRERIKKFKSGKFDVICAVQLLTMGFDHPNVGCVINGSPTMSKTRFLQRVGRGTRLKDELFIQKFGKNNCIIIDVTDNSERHNLINTKTLDAGKRFEDKVFMGEERRQALIGERDRKARSLDHTRLVDATVNLLTLPEFKVRLDEKWMKEPASQPQLDWLRREGYDVVNQEVTRGQADELISNMRCSAKDMRALIEAGYDVSGGCTVGQAKTALKEIARRGANDRFAQISKRSPFIIS